MYSALSKYYDLFMQSEKTDQWIDFVAGFLPEKSAGIDFACGTGRFTIGLKQKGFKVSGVDISAEMLSVARDKAERSGLKIEFLQGDMKKFIPFKPVSFITAMCDAINYVKDPARAFENFFQCLNTGGTLIFDISSEYKLKTVLGNNCFSEEEESVIYIWKNRLLNGLPRIEMDLTFFERVSGQQPGGIGNTEEQYLKKTETQIQYIHKTLDIVSALEKTGFKNIRYFANCTKKEPLPDTPRIHFIAQKG